MKDVLNIGLTATICLTLLAACAEPKGFQARKTRSEDLLIKEYRQLTPRERAEFQHWAGRDDNMRKVIYPRAIDENKGAEGPKVGDAKPPAGETAGTGSTEAADDALKAEGVGANRPVQRPAVELPKDEISSPAEASAKAEELQRQKNQQRIDALNIIAENGAEAAQSVIRGLQVSIKSGGDKKAVVVVESLMRIGGKDFIVSGIATLTEKDQLIDQKIVDLKLAAVDNVGTQVLISGIEMFTACLGPACDQVALFIKAKDESVVAVSATFAAKGVASGETTLISSTMGESIKSVKDAQAEASKPAARGETGGTDATGGSGATAGTGEVRDLGVINVTGSTKSEARDSEIRDLGTITVIGSAQPEIRDLGVITVTGNRAELLKEIEAEEAEKAAAEKAAEEKAAQEKAAEAGSNTSSM